MKVVAISNYSNPTVADVLLAENVSDVEAERVANEFNDKPRDTKYWAVVKSDDYKLYDQATIQQNLYGYDREG